MRSHRSCRLVRRSLDWDLEPHEALRLLRSDTHPVALLGAWAGGRDIIASEPTQVRCPPQPLGDVLESSWPPGSPITAGTHLASEDGELPGRGLPGFGGGWIGYLGFAVAEGLLPAPPAPGEARHLPAWWFGYYDHVVRREGDGGRWVFEALWTAERADAIERRFADLSTRQATADRQPRRYSCGEFSLHPSADEHRSAVRRAIRYIRRGDVFQANICLRLEASFRGDPLDAFCSASAVLQPPYAAFLRVPGGSVASLSPELFLRRAGREVVTRPIKGTRRRSPDQQDAATERDELLRSTKDQAENVMIVDLMRNDLSRVCVPGSVGVPRLLSAEAHPGVWHLVSDVAGTLPDGTGDGELVAAAFPPGSVTGAPKVRAVEIIHELEATPREVYTGAIGYRSPLAGLELNVAIRTFEFRDERAWLGVGSGITARSVDDDEYRECLVKAAPLVAALGARIDEVPGTPTDPPGRPSVARSLRPRPAAGVFTSLRVSNGQTHDLDGHLERLENSTWRLYGKRLPPGLRHQLMASIGGYSSGRLRITARLGGGPLQVSTEVIAVDTPPADASLRPVTIPGGLGAHKWLDRRLIADLTADRGGATGPDPGEHLMIQDHNGDVLETDRANIFAMIGGVLHTPPADGRLLPGITRAAVLQLAKDAGIVVEEAPLNSQRLGQASEVFVTNSVHGITPVRAVAGSPDVWSGGPAASRLAALLDARPVTGASVAGPGRPAHSHRTDSGGGRGPRRGPLVVVVDNYDSFTYNLAHLLMINDCRVEVVRNDEVSAHDIVSLGPAGIVISPGPCTPAEAGISIDTVRMSGPTTPLLGICLGHQAIAAAHGAQIICAAQPLHGRASPITHDDRGVLHGLPQHFPAARYHSLLVDEASLPPGLTVTARAPDGLPMGLRHAQHPTEGVQFHPESILTPQGGTIIGNFAQTMRRLGFGSARGLPRDTAASPVGAGPHERRSWCVDRAERCG